ncbi:MAG: 30S ribosomal protein S8 [Patescibacteria group bacterium]|jgi:small subunit ribosomal protein S8
MNTHPIADMLTRIRNASARGFATVKIPASRLKEAIAKLLVETGWIERVELVKPEEEAAHLLITLKYYRNRPVIRGLRLISKSGQRIYQGKTQLAKNRTSRSETLVISTSQGLKTNTEAKALGQGGEVLFKIW